MRNIKVKPGLEINEPYVLITYTTGFGKVPKSVEEFLKSNHRQLQGVVVSGNRNWGALFANAGDLISEQYNVPLLYKFEISGNENDVKLLRERIKQL